MDACRGNSQVCVSQGQAFTFTLACSAAIFKHSFQMPQTNLGCHNFISSKTPSQPPGTPKARQRHMVPEGAQQMASLEATGVLPAVAGTLARGSSLPTASVTTHPGCTMRMSVSPAFRKWQAHARNKEDPTRGWLEKVGAAIEDQNKTVSKTPLTPRQNRMALPQLHKGGDKDTEKLLQKLPGLPVCLSQVTGAASPNSDVAPWTGGSQSESSFHALFTPMVSILHSVPCSTAGPPGFCGFFSDLGGKAPAAEDEQRQRAKTLHGSRAKQKGRSRVLPKHFKNKEQGVKLPPVPSITPLNFSRNFTFSFFELPPYQSQQHWVQRQQFLSVLMKQLQ